MNQKVSNEITLHICVPTFKENDLAINFINCLKKSVYKNWILYMVNAFPKDNLKVKVSNQFKGLKDKIIFINGEESEFWSESVNRGLRKIKGNNKPHDKLIIANVDNSFSNELLSNLVNNHKSNMQLACVSINKEKKIIKTGIKVKSWFFAINQHLMLSKNIQEIEKKIVKADFLPVSLVIFPIEVVNKNIFIDSKYLPHYGGDYAYSIFLKSKGYLPFVDFSSVVENNELNTGYCTYRTKITLYNRLKNILSIKNQSSIRNRFWLVMRYYPIYSRPTAFLSYLIKTLIETFLGGGKISYLKNFLRRKL